MPLLEHHFNARSSSRRLFPHGIGLKKELYALLSGYYNYFTMFGNNHAQKFSINLSERIYNISVDTKKGLAFVGTSSKLICYNLKTGQQVWWKNIMGGGKNVACSPKQQCVFVSSSSDKKIYRYDYQGNQTGNISFSYDVSGLAVNDEIDILAVTYAVASGIIVRMATYSLPNLTTVNSYSSSDHYSQPVFKKGTTKIYAVVNRYIRKMDYNNLSSQTGVKAVGGNGTKLCHVDNDGMLYALSVDYVSSTSYKLMKINTSDDSLVFTVTALPSRSTISPAWITIDKNYIYVTYTPTTSEASLNPIIKVYDKAGNFVKDITQNPNTKQSAHAYDAPLMTTYEELNNRL